jgi:hypothetical protein
MVDRLKTQQPVKTGCCVRSWEDLKKKSKRNYGSSTITVFVYIFEIIFLILMAKINQVLFNC